MSHKYYRPTGRPVGRPPADSTDLSDDFDTTPDDWIYMIQGEIFISGEDEEKHLELDYAMVRLRKLGFTLIRHNPLSNRRYRKYTNRRVYEGTITSLLRRTRGGMTKEEFVVAFYKPEPWANNVQRRLAYSKAATTIYRLRDRRVIATMEDPDTGLLRIYHPSDPEYLQRQEEQGFTIPPQRRPQSTK